MYNVSSLMSSPPSSTTTNNNRRHPSLCAVCGDKASGKHYGVMSCDGCRGFFKRSVRRKIQYKCKGDSMCQVDVNRRNQCQACRFQRCLAVQMKPSAVQNERAPRQVLRRALPTSAATLRTSWTPPSALNPVGYVIESSPILMPMALTNLSAKHVSSPIWSTARLGLSDQSLNLSKSSSSSEPILSDISNTDETQMSTDDEYSSAMLCETASYILLESLRWLYSVPSFKNLHDNDQSILIENSWTILFLLTSAELKKFLEQNSFDDDQYFQMFQSLVKDLLVHSIDSTEFTLLKLILIFTSNDELHDRYLVEKYRQDALFMLTEHTRQGKYRRLAELLMLMGNIQENLMKIPLEKIFFRQLIQRISMKHLLESVRRHLSKYLH